MGFSYCLRLLSLKAVIAAGLLLGETSARSAMAETSAQSAEGTEKPVKGGAPGTNIDHLRLMAPMNNADGILNGYAYIEIRLTAATAAAQLEALDKMPFIQDAFVRDVNRSAVASPSDPMAVDIPALETRLLVDARTVVGPEKVKSVTVCTVQIALLHPKQPAAIDPTKAPDKSRCDG